MADPRPESTAPRRRHDFEASYASPGSPPWDIGRPQPAFQRLADRGQLVGRVLDVGCGTGEHALLAASLGFDAVGVDISPTAIALARSKASERNLNVRFVVSDALELSSLGEQFDTVLDCGLFHTFDDEERARFVDNLSSVVRPGGRYRMLCLREGAGGDRGPRRVTEAEIRASLAEGWNVDSIEPTVLEMRRARRRPRVLRRLWGGRRRGAARRAEAAAWLVAATRI